MKLTYREVLSCIANVSENIRRGNAHICFDPNHLTDCRYSLIAHTRSTFYKWVMLLLNARQTSSLVEKTMTETIKNLLSGNTQWANQTLENDPTFFEKLSQGQSPQFLWIGCSDSRVPETTITNSIPWFDFRATQYRQHGRSHR